MRKKKAEQLSPRKLLSHNSLPIRIRINERLRIQNMSKNLICSFFVGRWMITMYWSQTKHSRVRNRNRNSSSNRSLACAYVDGSLGFLSIFDMKLNWIFRFSKYSHLLRKSHQINWPQLRWNLLRLPRVLAIATERETETKHFDAFYLGYANANLKDSFER